MTKLALMQQTSVPIFVICNKKENKCEMKLYKYTFAKG